MPFLEKLKKTGIYLEKIEQLNRDLVRTGEINRLQTDLVREYLRDLYELYSEMGRDEPGEQMELVAEQEVVKSDPKQVDEVVEEETIPVAETEPVVEEPVHAAVVEEPVLSAGQTEIGPEEIPISLLEKFQKESKPSEVNRKTVSGKKLTELIPLNEKFMFIMEFFDNSISRYEAAIEDLNQMDSKTEVLDYMQKNAWSGDIMETQQDLIDRFIHIIDLKYSEE